MHMLVYLSDLALKVKKVCQPTTISIRSYCPGVVGDKSWKITFASSLCMNLSFTICCVTLPKVEL